MSKLKYLPWEWRYVFIAFIGRSLRQIKTVIAWIIPRINETNKIEALHKFFNWCYQVRFLEGGVIVHAWRLVPHPRRCAAASQHLPLQLSIDVNKAKKIDQIKKYFFYPWCVTSDHRRLPHITLVVVSCLWIFDTFLALQDTIRIEQNRHSVHKYSIILTLVDAGYIGLTKSWWVLALVVSIGLLAPEANIEIQNMQSFLLSRPTMDRVASVGSVLQRKRYILMLNCAQDMMKFNLTELNKMLFTNTAFANRYCVDLLGEPDSNLHINLQSTQYSSA